MLRQRGCTIAGSPEKDAGRMKSDAGTRRKRTPTTGRPGADQDGQKGATEENRSGPERSRHPGLDGNGLPNDSVAIAQDREGANADASVG
jgi:hypothetical protein